MTSTETDTGDDAVRCEIAATDGRFMTVDDLPPVNTRRWVIRRKAEVVQAVDCGLISLEDACARYSLSVEEFRAWKKAIDLDGLDGLRTTKYQHYKRQHTENNQ